MSSGEMITQQTGPNQVVHTRQDSTQELDNLFKSVLQNPEAAQSSWHNRKMPESFYKPTTHHTRVGSHSRDNSIDGSQPNEQQIAGPPVFHSKQKSCPAEMMSQGNSPARRVNTPFHSKTGSLEIMLDERSNLEHIPLPAGWEAAFTADGRRYYIDHNTKTTAWIDPRKQYLNAIRTPSHPQLPPTIADMLNSPLPQGWDKAVGSNNEVYFIDHENKKTSWYDPRLPSHFQLPGGKLRPGVNPGQFVQQRDIQNPMMSQGSPGVPSGMAPSLPLSPMGSHQRMPSNEALAGPAIVHQRMSSGGSGDLSNPRMSPADLRQMHLQEELMRQNILRQQGMSPEGMDMQTGQLSPGDPFIGSNGATFPTAGSESGSGNLHSKQGSGDSGLGGMSSNFSLVRASGEEYMDESMEDDGPQSRFTK
ncbi:transcriptional coactivator YAP1-like isoform X2 [Watersipora subatra]|uniref:transcriptional coactivator YAP1-like isoform X2 n=1 Tax=Watersipora subatra TaxID=2589382 RepID=UPI00355AD77C